MDEFVIKALREELGEDGYNLVVKMIGLMEKNSKSEAKTQIRKVIEDAADKRV